MKLQLHAAAASLLALALFSAGLAGAQRYKGSAPSAQDLMGGQIMLGFDSILQNLPQIKSGRLKALAVLGKVRSPTMPDVPTIAESAKWANVIKVAGIRAQ